MRDGIVCRSRIVMCQNDECAVSLCVGSRRVSRVLGMGYQGSIFSNCRTDFSKVIPTARQHGRCFTRSMRRSQRAHLLTKNWLSPNRRAESCWVRRACARACRRHVTKWGSGL